MSSKLAILLISVMLTGARLQAQDTSRSATAEAQGTVAIKEVISQIRDALVRVQKDLRTHRLPPLSSVDLTLKALVEKDTGGTFKLWIISFGVKREKDQTQTVTIHLTPPSPDDPKPVGAVNLGTALEQAIVSAAEGAQQSGTTEYPLMFSGLTVELEFAVKMTGNGKITVPEITPITAELSGQVAKNATQTIKIIFQDPKKPGNP